MSASATAKKVSPNVATQVAELKTLMREFRDDFSFLGPKPADASDAQPVKLKVHRELSAGGAGDGGHAGIEVMVSLPVGYPAEVAPGFRVEGTDPEKATVSEEQLEALEALLAEQAGYMPGMASVSCALQALDGLDLASLDVGQLGRWRSVFKLDLVNNTPVFTKGLKSLIDGQGLGCLWLYRTIGVQNNAKFSFSVDPLRAVHVLVDAPDRKAAADFMKQMRTSGDADMDMLGKPCRVQLSVVEEFELGARAEGIVAGMQREEYRTDEDLQTLMGPKLQAEAGKRKRDRD